MSRSLYGVPRLRTDHASVVKYLRDISIIGYVEWWKVYSEGHRRAKGANHEHMADLCRAVHIAGLNVTAECPVFPFEISAWPAIINRTQGPAFAWNQAYNICRAWSDLEDAGVRSPKVSGILPRLLASGVLSGKYSPAVIVNRAKVIEDQMLYEGLPDFRNEQMCLPWKAPREENPATSLN